MQIPFFDFTDPVETLDRIKKLKIFTGNSPHYETALALQGIAVIAALNEIISPSGSPFSILIPQLAFIQGAGSDVYVMVSGRRTRIQAGQVFGMLPETALDVMQQSDAQSLGLTRSNVAGFSGNPGFNQNFYIA